MNQYCGLLFGFDTESVEEEEDEEDFEVFIDESSDEDTKKPVVTHAEFIEQQREVLVEAEERLQKAKEFHSKRVEQFRLWYEPNEVHDFLVEEFRVLQETEEEQDEKKEEEHDEKKEEEQEEKKEEEKKEEEKKHGVNVKKE